MAKYRVEFSEDCTFNNNLHANDIVIDTINNRSLNIGSHYQQFIHDNTLEGNHIQLNIADNNTLHIQNKSIKSGTYYLANKETVIQYYQYFILGSLWMVVVKMPNNAGMYYLQCVDYEYNMLSQSFLMVGNRYSIGKKPNNIITVNDPFVSGNHAEIELKYESIKLIPNKASKNGTWVALIDGHINGDEIILRIGMKIYIKVTLISLTTRQHDALFKEDYNYK